MQQAKNPETDKKSDSYEIKEMDQMEAAGDIPHLSNAKSYCE